MKSTIDHTTVEIASSSADFKSVKDKPLMFITHTSTIPVDVDPEDMPCVLILACTSTHDEKECVCFGAMANLPIRDSNGFHSLINTLLKKMKEKKLVLAQAVTCIPKGAEKSRTLAEYLKAFSKRLQPEELKKAKVIGLDPRVSWNIKCLVVPGKKRMSFRYSVRQNSLHI